MIQSIVLQVALNTNKSILFQGFHNFVILQYTRRSILNVYILCIFHYLHTVCWNMEMLFLLKFKVNKHEILATAMLSNQKSINLCYKQIQGRNNYLYKFLNYCEIIALQIMRLGEYHNYMYKCTTIVILDTYCCIQISPKP